MQLSQSMNFLHTQNYLDDSSEYFLSLREWRILLSCHVGKEADMALEAIGTTEKRGKGLSGVAEEMQAQGIKAATEKRGRGAHNIGRLRAYF